MSEQIRDGFESWCKTLGFNIDKFDEDYIIASTEWAWKIWQASRAAMVVELPELKSFNASDEPDFAYEVAIDDIKCALDDAGVGYK